MTRPLRVAYCTNSVAMGGMENHVVELARGVTSLGCEVSAIVPDAQSIAPFVVELRNAGIPVETVTLQGPQSRRVYFSEALRLRKILQEGGIDVFHQHRTGPYHGKWACLAARSAGVRAIVATEHLPAFPLTGASRVVNAAADRVVDRIVTVCELDRRQQLRDTWRSATKVVTIHNGIDLSKFPTDAAPVRVSSARARFGVDGRGPVLGVLARLSIEKGHTYLLRALPLLLKEWPALMLLIAGEGPERQRLETETAELGISDHVRFLGQRSDVVDFLRAIDLMVLPSLKESFPIVLLEGMAMRRAAVATDVGGISEALIDGETGIVVPPADVEGISSAIARCLRGDAWLDMGAAARVRVERCFTAQAMAAKARALYTELVSGTAPARSADALSQ